MKQPVVNADNVVDLIQLSGYGTSPQNEVFYHVLYHVLSIFSQELWRGKSIGGLLGLGRLAANRKSN